MQILQPTPKRSLRKRGSHTQALRFGTAQPFWTLSQRCCSNKNTRTKANKQETDGLNHVAVFDFFVAVSLALSQNQPDSWTATIVQTFKIRRSSFKKTFFHKPKTATTTLRSLLPPSDDQHPLCHLTWWRVRGLLSSLRDIGNHRLDVNLSTNKTQLHVDYSQLHTQLLKKAATLTSVQSKVQSSNRFTTVRKLSMKVSHKK